MKKFIGIISITILLFTTVGCESEGSAKYIKEENDTKGEIELYYKGDLVTKYVIEFTVEFGDDDEFLEIYFKEAFEEIEEEVSDIEGVVYSFDVDDEKAYQKYEITLKGADLDEIEDQGIIIFDDTAKENGVSFEATEEDLIDEGYEKVEK